MRKRSATAKDHVARLAGSLFPGRARAEHRDNAEAGHGILIYKFSKFFAKVLHFSIATLGELDCRIISAQHGLANSDALDATAGNPSVY